MLKVYRFVTVSCAAVFILCSCALADEEAGQTPDWPWTVIGRVTDGQGNGLADVEVWASCGSHSMMPTGHAKTGADGYYRLKFGPQMVVHDESGEIDVEKSIEKTHPQPAFISPCRAGYYEENLARHGALSMARELPKPPDDRFPPDKTILPNKPGRVDFVLVPAASMSGRVVDQNGAPVKNERFYVGGDEMSPGAAVLCQFTTDDSGEFSVANVPLKSYHVRPADNLTHPRSEDLTFSRPGPHEVSVVLNREKQTLGAELVGTPEEKPAARENTPPRELLKHYLGEAQLPDSLYKAYADLVKAIQTGEQGNIERHCLPFSVTFTTKDRPPASREYGQDINMPFLKDGFHKYIFSFEERPDDTYLIHTGSTYMFFVETKTAGWKLYRYGDKPIE